jgi:hypothetical protein
MHLAVLIGASLLIGTGLFLMTIPIVLHLADRAHAAVRRDMLNERIRQ